jgi:hypothetical protein
MRKFLLITSLAVLAITSCSKDQEGCNDTRARNFDVNVIVDDGSCVYTALTFYADSSQYNGKTISDIEITIDGAVVGNFNGFFTVGNQVCDATNTAIYDTRGDTSVSWSAIIYLNGGTIVTNSNTYNGISSETCVIQQVIPE